MNNNEPNAYFLKSNRIYKNFYSATILMLNASSVDGQFKTM